MIASLSSGVAVFAAIIVVLWPYLFPDRLRSRMEQMASERELIRSRERQRINGSSGQLSLRSEPKKILKQIVDRLNLTKGVENSDISRSLMMAGLRGQGPMVTYLVARLLSPIGVFLVSLLYVPLFVLPDSPFLVNLTLAAVIGILAYFIPQLYVQNRITKRQLSIRQAWPDALDLLLICVECGMGVETAIDRVSTQIVRQSPELAEELDLTVAELAYLQDRRKAYENLAMRTGLDGVKSVVTSLVQSEKYGTPLSQSLRVLAQENRDMRMNEAEKKAAALPPKLTVPMILFFLPVLFVIIGMPAALEAMKVL